MNENYNIIDKYLIVKPKTRLNLKLLSIISLMITYKNEEVDSFFIIIKIYFSNSIIRNYN